MGKVVINETTLTAIGDAIRTQTGGTDLIAPGDMPAEILAIEGGGTGYVPTDEDLIYTGYLNNLFSEDRNKWLLENYKDRIKIQNATNLSSVFSSCSTTSLAGVEIGTSNSCNYLSTLFENCYYLTELPTITTAKGFQRWNGMFGSCYRLREVPDEFFENFDWTYADSQTSASGTMGTRIYNNCYSLRKASMIPLSHGSKTATSSTYAYMSGAFTYCYSLDEIVNFPINQTGKWSSNMFSDTFTNCNRIKELTFAPYGGTLNWSNQTIDLSEGIGYCQAYNETYILDYNSGITSDKKVTDIDSYKALKDDPDWYTTDAYYSRYNVDSAIRTLQSLPTTTGTGCTIKFKNLQGVERGGRIGGMDESYVAAAAAKGWTVAFVD